MNHAPFREMRPGSPDGRGHFTPGDHSAHQHQPNDVSLALGQCRAGVFRVPGPRPNEPPMPNNFVRIHQTLRVTPAMAAKVTPKLWEMSDLVKVLEDWEASAD